VKPIDAPIDRAALAAASAEANLAVLISAVPHLTGDLSLLDRYPDPGGSRRRLPPWRMTREPVLDDFVVRRG
jgi:hypothetical protein